MTKHELKVHPQFWAALKSGAKPFEVRRDDRKFRVGDLCILREYDPTYGYVGNVEIGLPITYVLAHEDFPMGLPVGYVVLGFGIQARLDDGR